jgi:hypothetical protein
MGIYVMEFFSGRTRYTSMGFTHNVGNGVFGGVTPLLTEFLKTHLLIHATLMPFVGLAYPLTLLLLALVLNPFLKSPYDQGLAKKGEQLR